MVKSLDEVRSRHSGSSGERPADSARVPPHALEAERSLLGAMLLSRDAIVEAVQVCSAQDFYRPAHGHVFDAITSLYGQGEPADPVTVADELQRAGLIDAVGGTAALISLQSDTPATTNAHRYARIVEEYALLRRLIAVANQIAELGYEIPEDVGAVIDQAESMVFEVAQRRVVDTMAPLRDLLEQGLDRLEALYERGEAITGVPTGYADLDEQLAGLQPSNLVIVGARPAMGKTSFALGIAAHAAMESGVPVLVFSLEMSHQEITQRLLCAEARVEATRLRNGKLLESDWPKISHAIGRLGDAPIYVDDNPNLTVMDIRAKARRLKSRAGLGLVVVDYLQLMTGRARSENRQVEVSEISRGLKILARELEVPVIALSQLNRTLETRSDKKPVLADLRESGCLTADTRVLRADTGAEVSLGELLANGERDIPVWSIDDRLKLVRATMTHVFASGVKPVFALQLASGRRVKASGNHPFLTIDGWRHLDDLVVGARVAVPRNLPDPAQPVTWDEREIVMVGVHGARGTACELARRQLAGVRPNTNVDTVPVEVWSQVKASMTSRSVTTRRLAAELDIQYCGSTMYKHAPSRGRLARVADLVDDEALHLLASSDVFWDTVASIEPLGSQPVFDATVLGTHNFIADGVVVHNSLEQDADVVIFLYRDEIYNAESPDRGVADVIVSKHRNGPTGVTQLAFLQQYTRFANMARI